MEAYKETELCKECIFKGLCKDCNLPHCKGEDYVKERTGVKREPF
jgi:hypothetical protein